MAKTATEQLTEVQAAITAVMSGQSYSVNGQSVTKADLDTLFKMETHYEAKVARESNDNPLLTASFNHD